jgi:rhodanese-related sulfurtransferase
LEDGSVGYRGDRERDGIVPGSIHIPCTVFEWRTDLDSPWRNPYLEDLDQQIILLCDHGYSTILAADTLVELGFTRAGDIIGGYADWREAGLPTTTSPLWRQGDELAGMRGRDCGSLTALGLTDALVRCPNSKNAKPLISRDV